VYQKLRIHHEIQPTESNGSEIRTETAQTGAILRDSREFSSLNRSSAIQARTHHPKAASSSAITEVREEEEERSEGSQREIGEGERKLTSEDPDQRIKETNQSLRITNSGNSQTFSNRIKKTITESQTM